MAGITRMLTHDSVVLAMQTHNVDAQPELFTTYKDSTDVLSRISIWQAARATSAATTFFKPCKIPELGGLEYIDAAVGYNNPCEVLVEEAQNIFPDHRRMHILSLGTGLSRVASIGSSRSSIMKSLKKIAISTNKVHLSMDRRYGSGEEADYFRFNVDRGLDTIGLSDWKKISQLTAYTRDYVKENQRTIKHCAETFADVNGFGPPRAGIRLNKTTKKKPADHGSTAGDPLYHIPFPKNKKFVERGRLEVDLSDMLLQAEGGQIVALVGLGGSGKTQLALHLCYKIKESVIECSVLWMPAYSRDAFTQACIELTSNLGLPHEEPEETFRKYLTSRQSGNWFLVLDNADDIHIVKSRGRHGKEKGIFDYIPRSDRGRILITTRSREVAITTAGTNTVEMYLMTPGESTRLLQNSLLRSLQPKAENPEGFSTLLARLNYLPLAITQASDYMNVNNTTIAEYLWLFDNTDRNQIQLLSQKIRDDSTLYSSDQAAVATTWIISFNEIRQNHEDAAVLLSFIAWIEPRNIPRFILPTAETEQQNTLAIGTLLGYGFLTRHQTDGVFEMHTFEMHSLVHTATRVWLERSSQAYNSKVLAIGWLCNVMPADWSENKRKRLYYLPHGLRAFRQIQFKAEDEQNQLLKAYLGYRIGLIFHDHEGYALSFVEVSKEVASIREAILPPEDPQRLESQRQLATALAVGKLLESRRSSNSIH